MALRTRNSIGFGVAILAIAGSLGFLSSPDSGDLPPTMRLYHPSPEAAGYAANIHERLSVYADSIPAETIIVVTDGKVLWEYGDTARIEAVASVRKSVFQILPVDGGKDFGKRREDFFQHHSSEPLRTV